MKPHNILSADLLDIIFYNRNKDYGAYELRKHYSRRLYTALLFMLALCILVIGTTALAKKASGPIASAPPAIDVILQNIGEEEKPTIELPPPPKAKAQPLEIARVTPPVIVPDEQVTDEDIIRENTSLENVQIGTINQAGQQSDVVAPPVEQGTGLATTPGTQNEDYDRVFFNVQKEAMFPGGDKAWIRFLERHLDNNTPVDNGAPAGRYTVIISFVVDKQGNLSEIKAENNPGFGSAEEAIRVIKKGPKWIPAEQNGRNVIYRQRQAITFVVEEA